MDHFSLECDQAGRHKNKILAASDHFISINDCSIRVSWSSLNGGAKTLLKYSRASLFSSLLVVHCYILISIRKTKNQFTAPIVIFLKDRMDFFLC